MTTTGDKNSDPRQAAHEADTRDELIQAEILREMADRPTTSLLDAMAALGRFHTVNPDLTPLGEWSEDEAAFAAEMETVFRGRPV